MPRILCLSGVLVSLLMAGGAQLTNAQSFPESFTRSLYILNGDFSSKMETVDDQGNTVTFYANISYIPISVEGMKNPTILYMETYPVERSLLLEAHQDSNGFVIFVVYTVPNDDAHESLNHSPAQMPKNASLEMTDGCQSVGKEIVPGFFDGDWIDCTREVNGQYPVYVFQVTCDYVLIIIDVDTDTLSIKYDFQAKRYPWPPEVLAKMAGTEDICERG